MADKGGGSSENRESSVADLLEKLNLTAEEEQVVEFNDDEDDGGNPSKGRAMVVKVISSSTVHAAAIYGAMKPAWGNPAGLKIRSVGAKAKNLFVAEFDYEQDME
jgi:hypothetical protein